VGWGRAGLDEVVENPEDLLGIGDDWPLAALARCCRLRRGSASGNHSGYSARGSRCVLRKQVPPMRPTSYTGPIAGRVAGEAHVVLVRSRRPCREEPQRRQCGTRQDGPETRLSNIPPFPPLASLSELQCILQAEDIPWGRLHVWRAGRTRALKNKPQDCVHGASCRMPEWRRSTPFAIMASASKEAP